MRKLLIITFLLLIGSPEIFSQFKYELGGLGGNVFYLGDVNNRIFTNNRATYGAFFRYNIDYRHVIRGNVSMGNVASGASNPNRLPIMVTAPFNNRFYDVGVNYEFNFFSFTREREAEASEFSPYIAVGCGITILPMASTSNYAINIPVGVGIKYLATDNLSLGCEWNIKKMLGDNIEENNGNVMLTDPIKLNNSILVGSDFISALQFSIAFRFGERVWNCSNILKGRNVRQ